VSSTTAHQYRTTTTATVTPVAAVSLTIAPNDTPRTVRFVSDVAVHLKWAVRDEDASVSTLDGYVPANCVEYITIGPNNQVEIIGAQGVTTGNAWFTEVSG